MQKFSGFRFFAFCFSLFALSFCSCSFNPNLQGKGAVFLQGEWKQQPDAVDKQLLTYSLYDLTFSCDSFFIQVNSYSKINNGPDSCMHNGHWTEYIKGSYQQRNDTLHLKGQFCNSDYTLKNEGGCFRSGIYEELFKISKKNDSLVQFSGASSVIPISAHLIKRTICQQKPL